MWDGRGQRKEGEGLINRSSPQGQPVLEQRTRRVLSKEGPFSLAASSGPLTSEPERALARTSAMVTRGRNGH